MFDVSDGDFDRLISEVMDELPQKYIAGLKNVAIVIADQPDESQKQKMKLRTHDLLFGLYEGIPLTKRTGNYSLVLPDKITLFKKPMLQISPNVAALREHTKRTLWHEIAHYYGLDHDRIDQLQNKSRRSH